MPSPDALVRSTPCALALLALLAAAACAKSEPAAGEQGAPAQAAASSGAEASGYQGHGHPAHGEMQAVCPMAVPGTTASAEDVEGGAALVLTTTGDKAELQRRARAFVEMHAKHAEHAGHGAGCDPASCPMHGKMAEGQPPGAGHGHGHGQGHEHGHGQGHEQGREHGEGCCGAAMAGVTSSVEDTDAGARIVYRPADAAQLEALREHLRHKADKMMHCPMRAEAAPPPAS